ncbi:hypothetical protein M404DRAFT_29419 [Pisolithus tinctorius Marx 270]|uniref:Uncharacterized protein n=1 Tax=Pisolithus tinctorius Marx 270 TaxID=870435 RepID=A0A0C3JSP8_PISTI|nr:hypothetical protein M404DRAFT_29419 [Pisolithus tinctorius Marx 270]
MFTPTLLDWVHSGGDPGDEGPDDDDPSNGPSDDGPSDDNLDENDPEDEPDFPDPDTEPAVTVFNSLTKAIKLLACNTCISPESSSRTKLCEPIPLMVLTPRSFVPSSSSVSLIFKTDPRILGLTMQRSSLPSPTSKAWP